MKRGVLLPVAAICLIVGFIFTGQGLGYIKGSVMTGSTFWEVVGIVLLVAGLGLGGLALRKRPGA